MGHETVGRIDDLGSEVTDLRSAARYRQPGDRLREVRSVSRPSATVVRRRRVLGVTPEIRPRSPTGCRPGPERRRAAGHHAGGVRGTGGAARRRLPRRLRGGSMR